MKRLALAAVFSLIAWPALAATCPVSTVQVKDNTGATANMTVGDDGSGAGNCEADVQIKGHAGASLDGTAGAAAAGVLTVQGVASMTPVLVTPSAAADPCMSVAKSNFALASAAGNTQVVAGVAAKKVYICSISIVGATASVINFIEGTGAACTTANEAAVIGSTTAASGMSLPANGGFTLGNGGGTVAVTATAANGICILQSGTAALAGNVTYVQQ